MSNTDWKKIGPELQELVSELKKEKKDLQDQLNKQRIKIDCLTSDLDSLSGLRNQQKDLKETNFNLKQIIGAYESKFESQVKKNIELQDLIEKQLKKINKQDQIIMDFQQRLEIGKDLIDDLVSRLL